MVLCHTPLTLLTLQIWMIRLFCLKFTFKNVHIQWYIINYKAQEAGKTWIQPFLCTLQYCFILESAAFTMFPLIYRSLFFVQQRSLAWHLSVCLSHSFFPRGVCMFSQPTLYLSLSLASNLPHLPQQSTHCFRFPSLFVSCCDSLLFIELQKKLKKNGLS